MKVFAVFFISTAVAVSGVPLKCETDTEGWFVPSVDGKFHWVSKKQYDTELKYIQPRAVSVQYYLYTQTNPTTPQQLDSNDENTLINSNFNKNNPTKIVIHGWQNNYKSDVNIFIRTAFLNVGSYNVISVDWSSVAGSLNYVLSRNSVPIIGKDVAEFINFLISKGGMPLNLLTLIGHSLGAHVSGFAGKEFTIEQVDVIIGLDPALPFFTYLDSTSRLCNTDATHVESIQTNGGKLGFRDPIGEVAFYPNGGASQPGCLIDLSGACAHSRAFIYYAESIMKTDAFPSINCSNLNAATANKCGNSLSNVNMGAPASYGSSGIYYVPVNSKSPYGTG